jgi:hypothetical protein
MNILAYLGTRPPTPTSRYKVSFVRAECPLCNKQFEAQARSIKSGHTKSCGCARLDGSSRQTTKTLRETCPRLYRIWKNMRTRCRSTTIKQAKNYALRGIGFDPVWDDYAVFYTWARESGYRDNLSIDRIDVDKGYSPSNCRWADQKTQMQNTQLLRITNTTGYRNVTVKGSKYMARVTDHKKGKRVCLGVFDSPETAAASHDAYVIEKGLGYPVNSLVSKK